MKIAVMLGAFSVGSRPLDFAALRSSPRGLTGTDLCFVRTCEELEKFGHEVWPHTVFTNRGGWERLVDVRGNREWRNYDAVISINEPNLLIGVPPTAKRVVWQMLNDFSFVQPGFDSWVDRYFGVCEQHTAYVAKQCPRPQKWGTIGLGCDPDLYTDRRVPGRVVYCSSPDRGLHWLLSCWPEIRRRVPEAHLRIFYHWGYPPEMLDQYEGATDTRGVPIAKETIEVSNRLRYIKRAIEALKTQGVEYVGSVSRDQMVQEWNEASVMAYPCDTVAFSEGFSVSILEAHASYTVPVITDADCLGGIYADSGAFMVRGPVRDHTAEYTDLVVKALLEPGLHCRGFALHHTWSQSIKELDAYLRG